jgi:hypothetical protein
MVVSMTDMLLTLPERHAQLLNMGLVNQMLPFPLQEPRLEAHLYWHESVENDPANRWLREEIEKVLAPERRTPAAMRKAGNGRREDRRDLAKLTSPAGTRTRRTNGRPAIQQ